VTVAFDEVSPEPAQGGGGGAFQDDSGSGSGRTREQDNALIAWVSEKYQLHRNERMPLERQWYVNLAFHFGRQNVAMTRDLTNTLGFSLHTPKAPPWRVRMVINHCRRIVRTEVSKLASQRPRPFVVPATTEDEDQIATRVGETILESRFQTPEYGQVHRSWIWWGSVCGTSFLKQYWDPHKEVKAGKKTVTGDICIDRLTPFEILVPNLAQEDIQKQPYVIHGQTMSVEQVKLYYGVDVLPDAVGLTDLMEDQFLHLVGAAQIRKDKVLVLETWIKPGMHPQFPQGGMFTVAGNKLVQVTDKWPYNHGEFPFYKYGGIFSGRFYGDSILVDVIPVQRELNRTRSQIVENKNLMGKPKLLAQRGSINPKLITSEPGQVILYQPGFEKPTPLPHQPLPGYISQELERLHVDLDDLSGQHEITRGTNPSQVTAATALSYLQEQDDSKLYYQVASIEDAISKLGSHYLELVTQYWDEPRMVRVVGSESIIEAEHWRGSDLNGNTDVHVMAGSGLPQSKAAKQAFIMDLIKLGMLPQDQALEMLEIGGLERIYEEVLVDKRQVMRENLIMSRLTEEEIEIRRQAKAAEAAIAQAQGSPEELASLALEHGDDAVSAIQDIADTTPEPIIPINSWDNHEFHIQYHNRFRKTQKFSTLPDAVKSEFELHIVAHQEALREEMMRQQGIDPAMQQQELMPAEQGAGGVAPGIDPEEPYEHPREAGGAIQPFGMDTGFTDTMNSGLSL
jgi:hypothetical protein